MNFIEDSFRPWLFALYFKNTVHVYNTKSKTMTFTFQTPQKTNIRLSTLIVTYVHTLSHQQVSLAAVAAVKNSLNHKIYIYSGWRKHVSWSLVLSVSFAKMQDPGIFWHLLLNLHYNCTMVTLLYFEISSQNWEILEDTTISSGFSAKNASSGATEDRLMTDRSLKKSAILE